MQFKRLARVLHSLPRTCEQPHILGLEDQSEIEQSKLDADGIRLCVRRYPACKQRIGS